MEYVFQCPCCGQILERPSELEPVHPESTMPKKQLEPPCDLHKPGKKWPCLLAGGITAALSLFLFPLLFVSDEPLDPLGVGIAAALLLLLIGLGMVLIFCRHRELEAIRQPIVAVRERNIVTVFGMILWLLGFIMMLRYCIWNTSVRGRLYNCHCLHRPAVYGAWNLDAVSRAQPKPADIPG